eukprot:Pgem_evm2s14806
MIYVAGVDYGYYASTCATRTSKVSRMTPFCLTWTGLQKYLHNSVSKHAKAYVEWTNNATRLHETPRDSTQLCYVHVQQTRKKKEEKEEKEL